MDRQFVPFGGGFSGFGGFGGFGRPFFRPFRHPFFPRRFLFPFFFISPFFFPFRGEDDRDDGCFAQHQVQDGDTLERIAHRYNIPCPILEEANPHIAGAQALKAGDTVYIPRISNLQCQRTYLERDDGFPGMYAQQAFAPHMAGEAGAMNAMYPGMNAMFAGTNAMFPGMNAMYPGSVSPFAGKTP